MLTPPTPGEDKDDALVEGTVVSVRLVPIAALAIPTRRREEPAPVCWMKPIRRDLRLATRFAGVSNSPTYLFSFRRSRRRKLRCEPKRQRGVMI